MDEKKKLMILGALVAVMACIGAFQMLKKPAGPPPPPPVAAGGAPTAPSATGTAPATASNASGATGTAVGKDDAKAAIKNPEVATPLPARNPFSVPADQRPKNQSSVVAVQGSPKPFPRYRGPSSVPPMLPGKLGDVGTLPSGAGVGDNPMAPSATPAEKPFGYRVVGAITGDRSAVVLQDSSGNQKLVPEGSAIDGESRVRRVENGAVWIEYRGKKLRVTVGGISVDKK